MAYLKAYTQMHSTDSDKDDKKGNKGNLINADDPKNKKVISDILSGKRF